MTVSPIRRLLDAKPFVSFTLHLAFQDMEFTIDDPARCRLDDEQMILYVSCPEVRPPKFVREMGIEPATVEVFDLRHVARVSVKAKSMPG